jgi:hypothetical protein
VAQQQRCVMSNAFDTTWDEPHANFRNTGTNAYEIVKRLIPAKSHFKPKRLSVRVRICRSGAGISIAPPEGKVIPLVARQAYIGARIGDSQAPIGAKMNARFGRPLPLLVLLLASLATQVWSQGIVTGSISGTVGDQTGAAVTNATITATETQTNRKFTATTNNAGQFTLRQLPPGDYNVDVTATGFQTFNAKDVRVVVGQDTAVNSKLTVGGETQTVTVEGAAPLIETQSDQVQTTFSTKDTASIPLGNTYDSFALFVPGVATAGSVSFGNNNGAELSVNGQRARSNNFQLDGQSNNDNSISGPNIFFGNQDAIAELQVITNYSAEYGRNMGSVVNYITKSGTNAYHGTAFEFNQINAFDSLTNQEKSPVFGFCAENEDPADGCQPVRGPSKFIDNRFGGTFGGPIKKDRIWFFGSGNFERQRFAGSPFASSPAVTPTPQGVQTGALQLFTRAVRV